MSVLTKINSGLENVDRRVFDDYILGPFLIWYGLKSKGMGKWPRRALVSAGIYQIMYSWPRYKNVALALKENPNVFQTAMTKIQEPFTPVS